MYHDGTSGGDSFGLIIGLLVGIGVLGLIAFAVAIVSEVVSRLSKAGPERNDFLKACLVLLLVLGAAVALVLLHQ